VAGRAREGARDDGDEHGAPRLQDTSAAAGKVVVLPLAVHGVDPDIIE
jgi:hypothetical protein